MKEKNIIKVLEKTKRDMNINKQKLLSSKSNNKQKGFHRNC